MHPIFERLKERKIVQWALAYVAGAVALYSALDAFAEPWGVGDFQLRIAQVGLLVGFFFAVTLAWYHGERGEQRVTGVELLILAGIMGLGAIGVRLVSGGPVQDSPSVVHVERQRLPRLAPNHAPLADFEFGPQGTGFTYALRPSGGPKWYRRWDALVGEPLVESLGGNNLVSPDGRYFAETWRGRELRLIDLEGQTVVRREMEIWGAATWGGDGYIYFPGPDSTIHRIAESLSGEITRLGIDRRSGDGMQRHLRKLPNFEKAIFAVDGDPPRIEGIDLETGERVVLHEGGLQPHVTSTGHLVFASTDGRILAASLDPRRLEIGPVVTVVGEAVSADMGAGSTGQVGWSLSSDGTLGYWEAQPMAAQTLAWVSTTGEVSEVDPAWGFNASTRPEWDLSPSGSLVAFRTWNGQSADIWVRNLASGVERLVTVGDLEGSDPQWLSDEELAYLDTDRVMMVETSDLSEPRQVFESEQRLTGLSVHESGWWVLSVGGSSSMSRGLNIIAVNMLDRERPMVELADPRFSEHNGVLSPNGQWIAYASTSSGEPQISVRPFPNVEDGEVPVSSGHGQNPQWSEDGARLYYISGTVNEERLLVGARVNAGGDFSVLGLDTLVALPERLTMATATTSPFLPTDDPERFLFTSFRDGEPNVVLVKNWFEELKRLVPN